MRLASSQARGQLLHAINPRTFSLPRRHVAARFKERQAGEDVTPSAPAGPGRPMYQANDPPTWSMELLPANEAASLMASEERSAKCRPSQEGLEIWQTADCVVFDVDCTVVGNHQMDLLHMLAEHKGVTGLVEEIDRRVEAGEMNPKEGLEEKLTKIECRPLDIKHCLSQHPPQSRLNKGVEKLIRTLQARGAHIYLVSGGFRELVMPVARYLGIPKENVFAQRMNWQWDHETGAPTKLVGFDKSKTTSEVGKAQALMMIKDRFPYHSVIMVGDDASDLAAVQDAEGVDLFIGYGGFAQTKSVEMGADWYVHHFDELTQALKRYKVAMIGSGAMACAAAHMVAQNIHGGDPADMFDPTVKMWVYEEDYQGGKLTDAINTLHENPKYLPGVALGQHVVACPELLDVARGADILIFCTPHQFVYGLCKKLAGKVSKQAIAISLTKGMRVGLDGPQLISQMISRSLNIDCSVLMGANIAADIGKEDLSEAVIGFYNTDNANLLQRLFKRKYFNVTTVQDVPGVELCGTFKNIVAVGAGIVDGLGYGNNTKAAIMRQGLAEMKKLSKALYPTIRDETFLETCGMADLIATCYGGRNRRVAVEWTKAIQAGSPKSFEQLEAELLNGQKLQGVLTSNEVQQVLGQRKWEQDYPLFTTINRIVNGELAPKEIVKWEDGAVRKGVDEEGNVHPHRERMQKLFDKWVEHWIPS